MKEEKRKAPNSAVAPGIDPDKAFGKKASKADIEQGYTTKVTRLSYNEYDK